MPSRSGMDLVLVILVILGWCFMWEWANDSEDVEDLAIAVAMVNSVVLTLYLASVIVPRYVQKIADLDMRRFVRDLGFYIPLAIIIGIMAYHGEIIDDPSQTRLWVGVYMMALLGIYITLKFIYQRFYVRKKDGKIENKGEL